MLYQVSVENRRKKQKNKNTKKTGRPNKTLKRTIKIGWIVDLLVGWLIGWLVSWLVGWLIRWVANWLVAKLVSWLVG